MANLATVGIVMGVSVALGLVAGIWLDRRLGTAPWFAVAGLILGSIAAFRELIRTVAQSRRGNDE